MGLPSIIGQCPECCAVTCDAPTIHWASRSASKTKCGFPEFTDVSTPPEIYLTITLSGEWVFTYQTGEIVSCDPCCDPEPDVCDLSRTITTSYSGSYTHGADCVPDGSAQSVFGNSGTCGTPSSTPTALTSAQAYDLHFGVGTTTVTKTKKAGTRTSPVAGDCSDQGYSDTSEVNLSVPYTTTVLKANTLAALPADYPNTTSGSYSNLTTDELTFSIRESKYWFTFPIPITRRRINGCYKIDWVERFTPLSGDPVDTPKTWTWSGTVPEGYDASDPETWPITPEYAVAIPETNGTTTVVDVVATCTGCT